VSSQAVDASVEIGTVRLPTPVITASGTFGYGTEFAGVADLARIGAISVKGLSLRPYEGKPPPRLLETPAGMLNAIGLQNIGVDAFLAERLPELVRHGARVVANFWGDSVDEFAECAARLDGHAGIVALELNAASPNRPEWGKVLAADPATLASIVTAVRQRVRLPLWVKLSPNVAVNTLRGMTIDAETGKPGLASVTGGLSGPAIKPVALAMVWQLAAALPIPVVGVGGVRTGTDAVEFLMAGAAAVQVGTTTFYDPAAPVRIADEVVSWCRGHDVTAVRALVGAARA
jgi:dihydroorotate dehydrogenase (NAD+) catalytic subunit